MAKIITSLASTTEVVHNNTQGLNDGDYIHLTQLEKDKFDSIENGAEVNVNADWNSISGDSEILNKPLTFPPSSHTHPISDITNLQIELDSKVESVTGINIVSVNNTDDNNPIIDIIGTKSQFNNAVSDGDILYVGDITQYTDELAQDSIGAIITDSSTIDITYDDVTPNISAIVKSNSIDATHLADNINISEFINDEGYITDVNLGYTPSPINGIITNDRGLDATIPVVDFTNAGLLTPEEKQLLYNNSSTGITRFNGFSINVDTTKYNTGIIEGWFVDNTTAPNTPTKVFKSFSATTGSILTNLSTQNVTYVAVDINGVHHQSGVPFEPEIQRDWIPLGVIVHSNRININAVNNQPVVAISPNAQLSDLIESIGFFNISGNIFTPNGTNLNINKSAGQVFKQGANFINNNKDPHTLALTSLLAPTNLRYRTQIGTEFANTAVIDAGFYDLAGVRTAIPGTRWSIQRIYLFQSNLVRIQYGQATYTTQAEAIQAITTEAFVVEQNILENGLFRALLIVREGATNLTDTSRALFIEASKFGSVAGLGSLSTTNLQQAYDNSLTPEITTNSTLGAVSIKRGSTLDTDNVFEVQNGAGTITSTIKGTGELTALTYNGYTPENVANKQNSLVTDGTGIKYATVDAINNNVLLKDASAQIKTGYLSIGTVPTQISSIVFIGDSNTVGYGLMDVSTRYSTLLCEQLKCTEVNNAVTGMTLQNGTPSGVGGSILTQLSLIPTYSGSNSYLYINLGTNDILLNTASYTASGFKIDYQTVINNAISKGWVASKIVLVVPTFISNYNYLAGGANLARHESYRDKILELSISNGTKYIDALKITTDNGSATLVQADGVHLSIAGGKIMATAEASLFTSVSGYGDAQITGQLTVGQIKDAPQFYSVVITTSDILNDYFELGYLNYNKNVSTFVELTMSNTDTAFGFPVYLGDTYGPNGRKYTVPINSWMVPNVWHTVYPTNLTGFSNGWETEAINTIQLEVKLITTGFTSSKFYFRIRNTIASKKQTLNINIATLERAYSSSFLKQTGTGNDSSVNANFLGNYNSVSVSDATTTNNSFNLYAKTLVKPALKAIANGDILVGLDIAPTFTNGAFTGVENTGLRLNNTNFKFIAGGTNNQIRWGTNAYFSSDGNGTFSLGFSSNSSNGTLNISALSQVTGLTGGFASGTNQNGANLIVYPKLGTGTGVSGATVFRSGFPVGSGSSLHTTADVMKIMPSTGNVILQNGGTFVDDLTNRLQVNGYSTATGWKTTGGTSSQFLKANGSVDSTIYAPIASPALTGTPTAPTVAAGTNTTQIATTAFVQSAVTTNIAQTITNGVTTSAPSQDAVFDALELKANLNGAIFTGGVEFTGIKITGDQNIGFYTTGKGLIAPNNGNISFLTNHPSTPGWTSNSNITATFYKTTVYTVATLPTTGVITGTYATVSDALTPTYMTTVVGGGAVVTPVFYNGTNWMAH